MVAKKKPAKKSAAQQEELAALRQEAELLDREALEAEPDRRPIGFRLNNPTPERDMGQRIQDARRRAGLTQKDLAERTKLLDSEGEGISRGALSLYEIGKNSPPPKELRLLCEALKVSPNRLVYGEDDPFDDFNDRSRYRFTSATGPTLYAQMIYRLHKLHHQDRMTVIKMIEALLFAENRKFDTEETSHAEDEFLKMAEALKAQRNKP